MPGEGRSMPHYCRSGGLALGGKIRALGPAVGGGLTPRGVIHASISAVGGGSCPWREDPRPVTAGRGGLALDGEIRVPLPSEGGGGQSREGNDEVPQEPSSKSENSILGSCCTPLEANCAQSEGRTQGGGGSLTYIFRHHSPMVHLCHMCGVGVPPGAQESLI